MLRIVCTVLDVYVIAVIARVILHWVGVPPDHMVGRVVVFLSKFVDPPLRKIGRVAPAIPIGRAKLDLSPLVLIIGIQLIARIIC